MKPDRLTSIIFSIIGVLLLATILYGIFGPKKVDWSNSFSLKDKRPFGTYILHEELSQLFPDSDIEVVEEPILDRLAFEDFSESSYLFINNSLDLNEYDIEELLRFVTSGNQAFLIGQSLPIELAQEIGVYVDYIRFLFRDLPEDSTLIHFTHPDLSTESYAFPLKRLTYAITIDEEYSNAKVIAQANNEQVYAVKVSLGKGELIICTIPHAFTNYHLIQEQHTDFASNLLSYGPDPVRLYWDEYYKTENLLRSSRRNRDQSSGGLFSYLFSKEALSWAFWILLGSILLYGMFEFKRTQRMIPIIKPLPNTTLDFTETVGRLYFQSRDHKAVALKKIKIFLGFVRSQYNLKTNEFSEEFIQTLAGKSGILPEDIRILCKKITAIRNQGDLTEEELVELNARIEHFYQHKAR